MKIEKIWFITLLFAFSIATVFGMEKGEKKYLTVRAVSDPVWVSIKNSDRSSFEDSEVTDPKKNAVRSRIFVSRGSPILIPVDEINLPLYIRTFLAKNKDNPTADSAAPIYDLEYAGRVYDLQGSKVLIINSLIGSPLEEIAIQSYPSMMGNKVRVMHRPAGFSSGGDEKEEPRVVYSPQVVR